LDVKLLHSTINRRRRRRTPLLNCKFEKKTINSLAGEDPTKVASFSNKESIKA
jgi:hypothetical protein